MSAHSVEAIKHDSRRLRGSLLASLADPVTGALADDDQTIIKYHGSYQQDDRDIREERRQQKLEPDYSFMIRTRTPGGVVTPTQWLQLDRIATSFAERGLRLTTRQAFQFHGVIKGELKSTMQAINAALVDTLAACGDVNRNIAVSANARSASVQAGVQAQAAALSRHLLPNSRAYYEIWLDEVQVAGSGEEVEPVYGSSYLPRKFKIAFAIPPDNDVDVYAQDLGFIAIVEAGVVLGYNVTVGGGMGASHGDPETYPRLGDVLGFIAHEQVTAVAEAVVTTQRDWGNRTVRKRARLKYTIDDRGLAAFKAEVERRSGVAFAESRVFAFEHNADRFGWQQDDEGRWQLHLRLPAGRIQGRALDGLRAVASKLVGSGAQFRLSANQNLVLAGLNAMQRVAIAPLLRQFGLENWEQATPTSLRALACVALPTCGLAMAEAERYLPDFVQRFEVLLDRHGLRDQPIHLRLSGCPNGCSRPYLAEVALVGKGPGRYNLMLGADQRGRRLNRLYRENLDEPAILNALDTLLAGYAAQRAPSEAFGDFLHRTGELA